MCQPINPKMFAPPMALGADAAGFSAPGVWAENAQPTVDVGNVKALKPPNLFPPTSPIFDPNNT